VAAITAPLKFAVSGRPNPYVGRGAPGQIFRTGSGPGHREFQGAVIAAPKIPSAAVAVSLTAGKPAAGNSRFQGAPKKLLFR